MFSKSFLSTTTLLPETVFALFERARVFKKALIERAPLSLSLKQKTVILLFLENSTRTRASFEIAAKKLGAETMVITPTHSSLEKGESVLDTVKTLEAMQPDLFVIRARQSGLPARIAEKINTAVINAGDGFHEHPSQALLDTFTLLEHFGSLAGKRISIVGDVLHSRVARSDLILFQKLGAKVQLVGPGSLLPKTEMSFGLPVFFNLNEGIKNADALVVLRIQRERIAQSLLPSFEEYAAYYGINDAILKNCKKGVVLLHPGPVNRGLELDPSVADGPQSKILDQVTNGVAVRMALLEWILGA